MLNRRGLKNHAECTSQSVKRTSGARVMTCLRLSRGVNVLFSSCSKIVTNDIRMIGCRGRVSAQGGSGGPCPPAGGSGGAWPPQGSRGVWGAAGPPMDGNLESEIGCPKLPAPTSDTLFLIQTNFESDFESEFCPSDSLFLNH